MYIIFNLLYIIILLKGQKEKMIPQDQIRFISSILVSTPLSYALSYLSNQSQRKYFSLLCALALQFYVWRYEILYPIMFHIFIYVLIKSIKREQCGPIITIVAIFVSSAYHIYNLIYHYASWNVDISTILMGAVCKYSLFAFSYQDGLTKHANYDRRQRQKIVELPNFMDYICYFIFLPSCLLNTPFDYKKYEDFIKLQGNFKEIPFDKAFKKIGEQVIFSMASLVIYFLHIKYFPLSEINSPGFTQKGFSYIAFYMFFSCKLARAKYYFLFRFTLIPIHASGISYEPHQKDPFLGIQAANPIEIQTTIHVREKVNNWNIGVQQWLRKCVYERLTYSKGINQCITFLLSAFWHGFYLGYYFSFGLFFIMIYASTLVYKASLNANHAIMKIYNKMPSFTYYIIYLIWSWMVESNTVYFLILSAKKSIDILHSTYYITPVALALIIMIFSFIPNRESKLREKPSQENKKAE